MEAPSLRIREVLGTYTEEDWNNLYKRLMLFAHKRYGWVRYKTGDLINAEDLVQEAMTATIAGVRFWPAHVGLFEFLCGVICSKVSHLRKSKVISIEEVLQTDTLTSSSLAQQEEVLQEYAFQQLCNKIREIVGDDSISTRIVERWFVEPDLKPRDMADRLGLSIAEVQSAQKRLKRRAKHLRKKGII